MSTPLPTWTGRALGKCQSCKVVHREDSSAWNLGGSTKRTCECGATYTMRAVNGVKTTKPCDARCMGAVGPSCDCSCGGENHGGRH